MSSSRVSRRPAMLRFVIASLTAALVLCWAPLADRAGAADRYWNVSSGDWSVSTNWNPQYVPTANDNAYIQNGGTAQILSGYAYADDLYISSNSRVEIHAGATLYMNYGGSRQFIGYLAGTTGTLVQYGGENLVGYHLYLGDGSGSSGYYTMSGGSLYVDNTLYAGHNGLGRFQQSAGSVSVNRLILGNNSSSNGAYRLSDSGTLLVRSGAYGIDVGTGDGLGRLEWFREGGIDASKINMGYNGTLAVGYDFNSVPSIVKDLNLATLEVTNDATVTKTADGVTSQVRYLRIGSSTGAGYGLQTGGTVEVGQSAYVGDGGTGVATQNGGTFTTTVHMHLGINGGQGTYRLRGGTLNVNSNLFGGNGASTLVLDGGTLNLGGNLLGYKSGSDDRRITNFILGDEVGRSGSFTLASGKTANVVAMTVGNLGTGTFSQAGAVYADSLTIGAGSSYTMTGGSLAVSGSAIVGQGGAATLDIGSRSPTVGSLTMRNGSISGTGTITAGSTYTVENGTIGAKLGGGVGLVKTINSGSVTLSGANTYTGATTLRAGTLIAGANSPHGAAGALGNATSAVVVGDAATQAGDNLSLLINGAHTVGRAVTVNNYGNNVTLGGTNTSGTATFGGNVSLARDVLLSAGGGSGGTVQFTGLASGSGKTATLVGSGNVKVAPASAGTTNVNYTVAVGGGRLLGGANTAGTVQFTGNVTLNKEVTLSAASGGTVEFLTGNWTTSNQAVTVTGAGTSVVQISNTLDTTAAVNVASGALRVNGILGGGGSPLTVALGATLGGGGEIDKPILVNGTIAPGASTGVLTVNDDLTLAGISSFELQAYREEGPGAGYYDGIVVGGTGNTLTFGGTLNVVNFGGGPTYEVGQVYDLFDWGDNGVTGTFSAVNLPSLGGGLQWKMFDSQPFDYATGQIVVELGTEVTHYGLAASVAPDVLLKGYVAATSSITCTGSGDMDTLDFTGLAAVCPPGGQITGPPLDGEDVQHGETRANLALTFHGTDYGDTLVRPTVAEATNHERGGDAILDWVNPARVNVGHAQAGPGDDRQVFGPPLVGQGKLIVLPGGDDGSGGVGLGEVVRDYAGLASKTTPSGWAEEGETIGTEAILREGIDSTARNTVRMEWRRRYDGPVGGEPGSEIPETLSLVSDVLRLTGMDVLPGETGDERRRADVFVLQMSYYDPERSGQPHWLAYLDLGDDQQVGGVGDNRDRWLPAVLGNFAGSPGALVNQRWDDFRADNPGELADLLGSWGWYDDGGEGVAWAVLDYNHAQFAVPEPGVLALLIVGAALLVLVSRPSRRRKSPSFP